MHRVVVLIAFTIVAGCAGVESPIRPIVGPAPPEFAAAPDTLEFSGQLLVLQCSLWRDFMPLAPARGGPLTVTGTVRGIDPGTMTSTIRVLALAVVYRGEAWLARLEPGVSIPELVSVYGRGGPDWGPGVMADVVARLRLPSGETRLLAARGVPIAKTE